MNIQVLTSNVSYLLIAIAVVCTLVTIVTEFTKEIGVLKKIPTDLQVFMTSMIVCIISFFVFLAYMKIKFQWYYLVAVIFAALFIAILCARGWKYVFSIWKRFRIDGGRKS